MTPLRRRVAIAVSPRLLADALSRVLAGEECDVVVLPVEEAGSDSDVHRFDIVLMSGAASPDVPGDVIIRLPETPTLGVARVGEERVTLRTLEDLVALIDRFAPSAGA